MDIWQILEIQPTPDQKAIKRAYAKKLKVTRPDENPQDFQQLHMAYKAALEEALYWEEEQEEWDRESAENSNGHYQQESLALETPVTQQPENLIGTGTEPEEINQIISDIPQRSEPFQQLENSQQVEITEDLHQAEHVAPEVPVVQIEESLTEKSIEPEPQQTIEINPYQVEGERLIALAEDLFKKQHAPARARSWEFIIESSFILEDQFNWQLGLELLRTINQHNLNHNTPNASMVTQEALSYLNSIFNWIDNRHHVIRALGNEYNTWLDMIKENNPDEKDYQSQIRGGKKLLLQQKNNPAHQAHTPSGKGELIGKRIAAWFIDVVILTIMIVLLSNGKNAETQQAISTQALTFVSILLIFVYFCGFEASALQATLGKKIMRLAIVNNEGDHPGFLAIAFRTFCYFAFCALFFLILPGILSIFKIGILSTFFTLFGIYLGLKPITLYDKISKTRTIELS